MQTPVENILGKIIRFGLDRQWGWFEWITWITGFDDHSIVGYDESDQIKYILSIPKAKKSLLRRFVQFGPKDPEGYDSYEISYSDVFELVHLLGGKEPSKLLQYFVEYHVSQVQPVPYSVSS